MSLITTPYWWESGAPLPVLPETPPKTTDLLVVGAGFTGLSAAITAAREGVSVTLVDAGVPGQGASTRNGGMAGAHPRLSLAATAKIWGWDTAVALFNEANAAYENLHELIAFGQIDCDYQHCGRVQLAWTKQHAENQRKLAADMQEHTDFPVELVSKGQIRDHIGSDQYFGALYYPTHGGLHPRKLHDGLMATALKLGVQIVQKCPVWDVSPYKGSFTARHKGGAITADKVILATNGYTSGKGIFAHLKRRVFPLPSFIIATEPLPAAQITSLAPGRRMMVESRARHSYFRISPDGTRILWGGRASMTPTSPENAAAKLRESMVQVWPELVDTKITHSWTGNTGFAFNQAPHVGEKDGIHYALGYCGGGVVLAPYLGMKAAYRVLGDPRGETAYGLTRFQTRPFHLGGKPWFLTGANLWYNNVADTRETAQACKDHQSAL